MKRFLISTALVSLLSLLFVAPLTNSAYAYDIDSAKNQACSGIDDTTGDGCDGNSSDQLNSLVNDVINFMSILVGIIAIVMLIFSGFKLIISGGQSEGVAGAKKGVIFALVGLLIAALAQFIVHFVLNKAVTTTTRSDETSLISRYS